MKKHRLLCNNNWGNINKPTAGEVLAFENWNRKFTTDICGFLDFETVQVEDKDNPDTKEMRAYQYSLIFVDRDMKLIYEKREFSPDGKAGEMVVSTLLDIEERLFKTARRQKAMILTAKDKATIRKATHCHICEKKFSHGEKRARDHNHYSGAFIGCEFFFHKTVKFALGRLMH